MLPEHAIQSHFLFQRIQAFLTVQQHKTFDNDTHSKDDYLTRKHKGGLYKS